MIIPDGFNLYISDDEILAIPGGYVRPFLFNYNNLNVAGGALDLTVHTIPDNTIVQLTSISARYTGTVPVFQNVYITSGGVSIFLLADRAPITAEPAIVYLDHLLLPGDIIKYTTPSSTAGNDVMVTLGGYQWTNVGL